MKYRFNEGALVVPEYLDDRTVNLLAPKLGSAGLTIAVTRDPLEGQESLQQFVDRQLADLTRQVSKYEKGAQELVQLGHNRFGLEGFKFPVSYKQQGKLVHHVQAVFLIPANQNVLSVTFSSPVPFTAEHQHVINSVLASFEPHTT